jgi:hypothetical protein
VSAHGAIQAAASQLRFATRVLAQIGDVVFQNIKCRETLGEGVGQAGGLHEFQIIGRSVIFGEFAVGRSHEASYRQIETRRAVLPLIVPIRGKLVYGIVVAGMFQNLNDRAVNTCIASAALLIVDETAVSGTGKHQAVLNLAGMILIQAQPSD